MNNLAGGQSGPSSSFVSGTNGLAADIPNAEQLIGKFANLEIEHLIGRGGMGAVYKAQQTNLGRSVALKILSPRLGSDPSFTERFAREARTLARLAHPNIVTVFDFGSTDSMPYLVMEYIDGVNLRDAIQMGRVKAERALEIVQQICQALQYAHDSGIIHRDIKPENILIDRRGHVKIADFGLAKLLEPTPEEFTLTGTRQVMGTLSYMAPEQIEKPHTVDHRADLYSLGVVFYELLTGELPIGRFALPSEKSLCGSGLDEVVMRTLEKEPNRRFQQASQIRTAVETLDPNDRPADQGVGGASSANRTREFNGAPISDAIPFSMGWVSVPGTNPLQRMSSLAVASGIARAFEDRIELEFELRDGAHGNKIVKTDLPSDQIASIDYRGILAQKHICLQAKSLDAVKEIPGARSGTVMLKTKWSDAAKATNFVDQVSARLQSNLPGQLNVAQPPIKSGTSLVTEEDVVIYNERIKVPQAGLLFCSVIQLIAWVAFFIGAIVQFQFWYRSNNSPDWKGPPASDELAFGFLAWSFGSLVTAIVLFFIARNLKQRLNYQFVVAGLIVCIFLPFSPAVFAQLPFVVWALIVVAMRQTRQIFHEQTLNVRLGNRADRASGLASTDSLFNQLKVWHLVVGIVGLLVVLSLLLSKLRDLLLHLEFYGIGHLLGFSTLEFGVIVLLLGILAYGAFRFSGIFSSRRVDE